MSIMDANEANLIERCLRGHQASCNQLYSTYAGLVRAYLHRCGFDLTDADDLTQDVFVRVFKSLKTFNFTKGTFPQWLGAISRNVARKRWRRRPEPENFDPELAEQVFATHDNPGRTCQAHEEIDALRLCVDSLPADLARIVRLRYVQGRTTRGIAEATDMAESTVRLRLTEAMDLLERCLAGKGVLAPESMPAQAG